MSSSTSLPPFDPLPLPWFIFFAFIEPLTTCAGAYVAIFTPEQFYHDLIPQAFRGGLASAGGVKAALKGVTGGSSTSLLALGEEGRVAVSQLGSCYLLLAMLSSFVIPTVRSTLCDPKTATPHSIRAAEKITRNMLIALGIADWIHILLTLQLLPPQPTTSILDFSTLSSKVVYLASNPTSWNPLLAGNVLATIGLFVARSLWMAGVGRRRSGSSTSGGAASKGGKRQ